MRDENTTDDRGEALHALWERFGRSAPVAMATAQSTIVNTNPAADAADDDDDGDGGGCGCSLGRKP